MTIQDFVPVSCYEAIKKDIEQRNTFVYEKKVKEKSGEYQVRIDGKNIDRDLAERVWKGNDYIFGFDLHYHGSEIGYGGGGFCSVDFSVFESWEKFKKWFDQRLIKFSDYGYEISTDDYCQMSLF